MNKLEMKQMDRLEKKLTELRKQGNEYVNIFQVIDWIYDIRYENRLRKSLRK